MTEVSLEQLFLDVARDKLADPTLPDTVWSLSSAPSSKLVATSPTVMRWDPDVNLFFWNAAPLEMVVLRVGDDFVMIPTGAWLHNPLRPSESTERIHRQRNWANPSPLK
jgi:hypothetical protein